MIYIHMMDRHNRFRRKSRPAVLSRSYFAVSWGAPLIYWLADLIPSAFHSIMDEKGYLTHLSPEHEHPERTRSTSQQRKRMAKNAEQVSPLYILAALRK